MDLGSGEYLIISNCMEMPFDTLGIRDFMRKIESYIENVDNIVFYNCKPNQINYDLVWEGLETFTKGKLDYNDITQYPLSSIDIKFKDDMVGRFLVTFLDKLSHEISLITNYTESFQECNYSNIKYRKANRVEQLAFKMFELLRPVYGGVGIETSSEGLMDLKLDNSLLPIEKVYYSNKICESDIQSYFTNIRFIKNLKDGIYMRNSSVDDYLYKENLDLKEKIIKNINFK